KYKGKDGKEYTGRDNQDIYATENGKYALHLSKLLEIAQAGGMNIVDSHIIERKVDKDGNIIFVNHQVTVTIMQIDGSLIKLTVTGKYDYYRDILRYSKEGETTINAQVKARRAHAEALAEANALSRAINKCFPKIPRTFTLDELKKPILIHRVVEDINEMINELPENDKKEIKKLQVMKQLGILDTLFPNTAKKDELQTPKINPQSLQPIVPTQIIETVDTSDDDDEGDTGIADNLPITISREEEISMIENDWKLASQEERTKFILAEIEKKKYKPADGKKITKERIEGISIDKQCEFIKKLLLMEVK
ncbi:MAG TPA: hypothetical protein P5215_06605, partial [Bacteroidales bacterium]|nr:hypothetical protein [Bacteroidales bacterium]